MSKVNISDHITYKNLFKLNIGPILMMTFISLYGIVDGLFIANFSDNPSSFAGVNLIFPIIMLIGGTGFMFGAGGSALVGKHLGQQRNELANQTFTNILLSGFIAGIILSILGYIFIPNLAEWLASVTEGSTPEMVSEAIKYGRICMLGQAFFITQNLFQNFLMVDGKPNLGFTFTLASGLTNIFLDFLFIVVLKMGVIGAGLGTTVGYIVGSIGPLIYFIKKKDGNIFLAKPTIDFRRVLFCCYNGSSEFLNNVSNTFVSILLNFYLLDFYSENGVSAYGIILYVLLIFLSIFIGYSTGTCPCISYQFGAKNHDELKNIIKKSFIIIGVSSILMFVFGVTLARPIALLFSHGNQELIELTTRAMRIFSIAFAFCGFSMFITSMFTALENGLISAILSVIRTLFLQVLMIVILPLIFNSHDAIWWYAPAQEFLALILSFSLFFAFKKRYKY